VPCPDPSRLGAYFDGETGAAATAELEHHIQGCADCRARLADLSAMRVSLRRAFPQEAAPTELRQRILRALEADAHSGAARRRSAPGIMRTRSFWVGAASGIATAAVAATVALVAVTSLLGNARVDELTSAHVHSLLPEHLIAVVSTDRHTVKPWFAGRADVSPVVADFEAQGYRLAGGRVDPIAGQRAAVLVYEHGAHVINVFSWSSDAHPLPRDATRNGYHLAFWKTGNVEYCAVSDTGWDELLGLEHLLVAVGARDERG